MKKLKKAISLLLCSISVLLPACALGGGGEQEETGGYVTIENFESYTTVSRIHCDNKIGDGRITKDYKSEGNSSFQITVTPPQATAGTLASTFFYVPTYGNVGRYTDFSMIDEISLDVYGVSGTDVTVGIAAAVKNKTATTGPVQKYEVKSGEWTTISCPVNRTVTSTMMNVKKITDVMISVAGRDAVVCVDNLQLHQATAEYVPATVTLDKGEFCDFEKAYQSFMVSAQETNGYTPTLKIVTDPEKATSGARSLSIYSPEVEVGGYFYMAFDAQLFTASKFDEYSSETSYLLFDVYKPFEANWKFTLRMLNASNAYNNMAVRVPAGIGWHTICVPLANKVTKTNKIQFAWQAMSSFPNKKGGYELFVDNMRLERSLPEIDGSVYVVAKL